MEDFYPFSYVDEPVPISKLEVSFVVTVLLSGRGVFVETVLVSGRGVFLKSLDGYELCLYFAVAAKK